MSALLGALALAAVASASPAPADGARCTAAEWPHWSRYVQAFVSADGRVIDRTTRDRTTSEGQAYALFFSLVADDRALFERVLRWTQDNLAASDLSRNLPAWEWGRRPDGSWGVLDANSASDADLWLAYTLLEAGRLWSSPGYVTLGRAILSGIAKQEVSELPALGPTLLPGPRGFALDEGRGWRLNPSYVPPQLLRRIERADPHGPWAGVLASSLRMLHDSAPRGVVADWVLYTPGGAFSVDPVTGAVGSYDAIRVYLWAGMLPDADPARRLLHRSTAGLLEVVQRTRAIPEKIDTATLRTDGAAPVGFYAALLPLARSDAPSIVGQLDARVDASSHDGLYGDPPAYYDQNLILFARGFLERRFRFGRDGALEPAWGGRCAPARS